MLRSSPSLDDPKARELVKGILANPVLGKLDPQLVARFRQLIHQTTVQQGGSLPGGEISGFSSSSSSPSDPQLDNRSGPKPDPGTSPDTAPSGLSAQQNEKPPPPSTRSLSPQMAERLKQFAERLRNSSLGDSPAVQRLIEGLGKVRVGNDSDPSLWEKWGTDLAGRLESWGSHLSQDFALPKIDLPQPRAVSFPKGSHRVSHQSLPVVVNPGGDTSPTVILVLALVLLGGLGVWLGLGNWARRQARNRLQRQQRGSWPIRPEAVHTREELVWAFEYLSLFLLGPAARTKNHREIAHHLGSETPEGTPQRREAAQRLAALYEQARYAPPDEILPEPELAAARQALSFLAGAPSA